MTMEWLSDFLARQARTAPLIDARAVDLGILPELASGVPGHCPLDRCWPPDLAARGAARRAPCHAAPGVCPAMTNNELIARAEQNLKWAEEIVAEAAANANRSVLVNSDALAVALRVADTYVRIARGYTELAVARK